MRPLARLIALTALAAAVFALPAQADPPAPGNGAGSEAIAPLVDIGGRRLYRAVVGTGGPTVVRAVLPCG